MACFFVRECLFKANERKISVDLLIRINSDVKLCAQSNQVSSERRRSRKDNGCIHGIFNEFNNNNFSNEIEFLSLFVFDFRVVSQWIWIAFFLGASKLPKFFAKKSK